MKLLYLIWSLCCASIWAEPKQIELQISYPHRPDKPCVHIEIEGQRFLQLFDLGAECEMALTHSALASVQRKDLFSQSNFTWFSGITEKTMHYFIPLAKINDFPLKNVIVMGISEQIFSQSQKVQGLIGCRILERWNVLLDFSRSKIHLIPPASELSSISDDIDSWLKVNFHLQLCGSGIVVTVITDMGEIPFVLDTGSPYTIIDRSFLENAEKLSEESEIEWTSSKFKLGDFDFGEQKMWAVKWKKISDEQGILGMDFLQKRVLYIDYPNKTLYIKR